MKRFQKILVYVQPGHEGPEPALARAVELWRSHGASVTVATVMEDLDEKMSRQLSGKLSVSIDLQSVLAEHLEQRLRQLVAPLQEDGVDVTTRLLHGSPLVALVREVMDSGHQLVMKTSHPDTDKPTLHFGSLAVRLMRKSPSAVWIVQPTTCSPTKRVLAAVEPRPDQPGDPLNRKVLELASSLAEADNAELHVVSAWSAYGESVLRSRLSKDDLTAYTEASRTEAEQRLQSLLDLALPDRQDMTVHLPKGDAGHAITKLVDAQCMDLIVMGTVLRSGVSGLLMGNTAEKTVHQVNCSLLTVKPEDFVSPISPQDS
jgi:nucleotide-binding universal stress UspA family protein